MAKIAQDQAPELSRSASGGPDDDVAPNPSTYIDPAYPVSPANPLLSASANTAVQNPTNPGSGSGNAYIDSLIWGNAAWSTTSGPITYWLGSSSDANRPSGPLGTWSADQRAAVTNSLANYAAVANVTFDEATSEATANMVFFQIQTTGSTLAFAEIPNGQGGHGGNRNQVWLQFGYNQTASWSQIQQGGDGYQTVLHEIGHSMGLAHPHDGGDQPDASNFPGVTNSSDIGTFGLNQGPFTAMSYNVGYNVQPNTTQAFGENASLGALDIAALQRIYGANNTYRSGNDSYSLPTVNQATTANQMGAFWSCIWDTNGTDTISAAGATASATIDLRAATLTGQNAGGYISRVNGIQGGVTIANGVVIENAIGGSAADRLTGNSADNVFTGGAGADTITGGAGADTLRDTAANLDGDVFTDFTNADIINVSDAGIGVTNLTFSGTTLSFTSGSGNHSLQLQGGTVTGTVQQRVDVNGGVDIFFAAPVVPGAPVYAIAVAPTTGAEGTATGSGSTFTYTVTRTGDTSQAGSVAVALSGTATVPGQTGADYATSLQNGMVTFAANATTATFTVTTTPDALFEGDETVVATLGAITGGGSLGTASATATITNDDTAPTLALSPTAITLVEGNSGSASYTYTVTRTGDAQAAQTVAYAVTGTGANPANAADFTGNALPAGTLTFAQGQTSQTITVQVAGDTTVEPDEGFTLTLSNPNFGTITQASATGTITNDDSVAPTPTPAPAPAPAPNPVPAGVAQMGTSGADLINGGTGNDTLSGLSGNDTVFGKEGNDLIQGNQGEDLLFGNQGNDTLFGGQGQDTLFGGQDADLLFGNLGADLLMGNLGTDTLFGGQGNDSLYGGQGDDVLFGDLGDDVLSGDLGNDVLRGGAGADRYVFNVNSGADVVLGFSAAEGDRLDLRGQTYTFGVAADGSGSALLVLSGGGTIELAGITQAQVNPGFFA